MVYDNNSIYNHNYNLEYLILLAWSDSSFLKYEIIWSWLIVASWKDVLQPPNNRTSATVSFSIHWQPD